MTEMKWNTNYGNYVYRVPEGLRELCSDISREVLRTQPKNIYHFIADYVDARLARLDNAEVAVKIVNNVLRDSELIVNTLNCMGLDLKQIAAAAPQLQNAFRSYLEDIDSQLSQKTNGNSIRDDNCDITSKISAQDILKTARMSLKDAEKTTTKIQSALRDKKVEMRTCIPDTPQQTSTMSMIKILCKADITSKRLRRKCNQSLDKKN